MARELSELQISTRPGGLNNTLIVTVTHVPTGASAEAEAHSRGEAKHMARQRLADLAVVRDWMEA